MSECVTKIVWDQTSRIHLQSTSYNPLENVVQVGTFKTSSLYKCRGGYMIVKKKGQMTATS